MYPHTDFTINYNFFKFVQYYAVVDFIKRFCKAFDKVDHCKVEKVETQKVETQIGEWFKNMHSVRLPRPHLAIK